MAAQPITFKPVPNRNGIIQVITNEDKDYYTAQDVMRILGVSRPKAYKLIRALREELVSSGRLISEYPAGRIPKKYYDARCGVDL